jgi:glutamate-1-semialdehyde aminotransferase
VKEMNTGHKLWDRAVKSIPGGNGLLSKRPDRYAPDIWPTYYSRAEGCEIWDLDGNKYIDMAQMGIGSAILGYANEELNAAVNDAIADGVSTTLNAPEEVYLAEKLLDLNPFAKSVKFARTGGEAMSMAVRIARAYSGRDKIVFSGYHGWCDWYLAANLTSENNLTDHLLPGLDPKGVPNSLTNTALPFRYNDTEDFKRLIDANPDVGGIIIEGARYDFPTQVFLNEIQTVARERDIVIVVDEITSGWRMTDGGIYKLNGFNPDIVVYGKAMGGGFAISAVVGRYEVMNEAQNTFISSTFWTERVGFAAALKTIEILTRDKVWEHLVRIGNRIGNGWMRLAKKHELKLHITDFKPLITMKFEYGDLNNSILTLFTQEMLKRGYLVSASVYVSSAHTDIVVDEYLGHIDEAFGIISEAIRSNTVSESLKTKVRSDSFSRLT